MLLVGLTGGMGSGKTSVARELASRGAEVIDADAIAREILEPGGPAYAPVVERFGAAVVLPDGAIDRPALAAAAFADRGALADLNGLTHPVIGRVMAERLQAVSGATIVVLDIPLLDIATKARFAFGAIVVVDVPEEVAVSRLVGQRGFAEADVRARIAAQMGREERCRLADVVIDNSAGCAQLRAEVDRVWDWLQARAAGGQGGEAQAGERPGARAPAPSTPAVGGPAPSTPAVGVAEDPAPANAAPGGRGTGPK